LGFLANGHRGEKLALRRKLLAAPPPESEPPRRRQGRLRDLTGQEINACPCGGRMRTYCVIPLQPPPRPTMGV
jgi:hypothetical protein